MLLDELKTLYLREVATLERELNLYPDDSSVWKELPGLPNPAGPLFLHLAGSLQHFFGAVLGGSGYVRDRAAEFSRHGVPRSEIKKELSRAREGVRAGFANLSEDHLEEVFPVQYADVEFPARLTLLQFLNRLAVHLGRIDYHWRVVKVNPASAGAVTASELARK